MRIVFLILLIFIGNVYALPKDFVYLRDVDPSIMQDIRYAGYHNFVGRPIEGYETNECILTKAAAHQLSKVQSELHRSGYSLKVYDCYRPQMAVNDFIQWSEKPRLQVTKAEFYPNVNKKDFFDLGYVAKQSGHTRGSTMDLTMVKLPGLQEPAYHRGQALVACNASYGERFKDNGIDMGTGFDCLDETAHTFNRSIPIVAHYNRLILRDVMVKYGFEPYDKEWWHFTLKDEPYPDTYFNFPIVPPDQA